MEFQVGDRVKIIKRHPAFMSGMKAGKLATVVQVFPTSVDIVFDDDVGGHTLSGQCKKGHGWAVFGTERDCLELANPEVAIPIDVSAFL